MYKKYYHARNLSMKPVIVLCCISCRSTCTCFISVKNLALKWLLNKITILINILLFSIIFGCQLQVSDLDICLQTVNFVFQMERSTNISALFHMRVVSKYTKNIKPAIYLQFYAFHLQSNLCALKYFSSLHLYISYN